MLASALELGGQRCGGDNAEESVGHLGVDLQRRDPCCDVEGVLVHHGLEAVVGCHRGQRGGQSVERSGFRLEDNGNKSSTLRTGASRQ